VNRSTRASDYGSLPGYYSELPALEYSADGKRLAMAVSNDLSDQYNRIVDTIIVYDLESRAVVLSSDLASLGVSLPGYLQNNFALSPDGKFVAFQCYQGLDAGPESWQNRKQMITMIDVETGKGKTVRKLDQANQGSRGLGFSPDGKWLMNTAMSIGISSGSCTNIFDMKTKKKIQ